MEKRILFLQPNRLSCYCVAKGDARLEKEWRLQSDDLSDDLPSDLRVYLSKHRQSEFSLLIDLPEEECHLESLITLSRRDRNHLITRLKNKRFANALLSNASLTASIADKRSSTSVLLSGIVANKACANLIRRLRQSEICLRSVHSPVTLASAIAKVTFSRSGPCLFVLPMQGSYRIIACINSFVLLNRRIVVSEPASTSTNGNSSVSNSNKEILSTSLTETLMYLERQQTDGWASPKLLLVNSVLPDNDLSQALKPLTESGQVSEIAEFTPAKTNIESSLNAAEALLIVAASRCGNGYATSEHRESYTLRKVRNVCAALALCGVSSAATAAAVVHKVSDGNQTLNHAYSNSSLLLQNMSADQIVDHGYSVEAVRQAMVTSRLIELTATHSPMGFLTDLAIDVRSQPEISVTQVHWENEDVLREDTLPQTLMLPDAMEQLDVEQIYRATVSGIVQGRPEVALKTFETFVSNLRDANSDPSVVVVETPFGLGSRDKTTDSDLVDTRGEFVLELSTAGHVR